jgi:hypothetical protein
MPAERASASSASASSIAIAPASETEASERLSAEGMAALLGFELRGWLRYTFSMVRADTRSNEPAPKLL